MKRKTIFSLLIAVVIATLAFGVAFAAEANAPGGPGGRGGRGNLGQVTAIGGDSITVETLAGESLTILVDADTEYHAKDADEVSLADIRVGDWVAGRGELNEDGELVATAVGLLPEDFDPEAIGQGRACPEGEECARAGGTVVSVSGNTLTIEDREGETLVVTATADTEFRSKDESFTALSELEVGDNVGFAYNEANEILSIGTGGDCAGGHGPGGRGPGGNGEGFGPGQGDADGTGFGFGAPDSDG